MKILIVSVTQFKFASVDRLAEMIKEHNKDLEIDIFPFHPRRYSEEDKKIFEEKAKWADLIDFQYFKSAMILLEMFPWLKDKPKILTHHNPYNLHEHSWEEFDKIIVKNKTQQKELPGSILIRHGVDLDFFKFNKDYKMNPVVVGMVAFRIEATKGIKEVAQVCKELGFKFLLVGHLSDPPYFEEVMKANPDTIFREDVSDEELRQAYYEMSVLVCNSKDNFESGTLPILEAMACGTPVLTRNIGLVPDIYDGKNMIVRIGWLDDIENLKINLFNMIYSEKNWVIRKSAIESVKAYSSQKMAKQYAKIYKEVLSS